MSRIVTYPYLRPLADKVRAESWQTGGGDGPEEVLADTLPHWDCNTPVLARRTVHIDAAGVRKDCALEPSDLLRIITVWHSSGTSLRGAGRSIDILPGAAQLSVLLDLEVDGTLLAGDITIRTQLILAQSGTNSRSLKPTFAGSVLWEEEKKILLEGLSARFPVEAIDFSRTSWLPNDAGWFLDWDSNDLHQRMLGGPRLYVNSAHPSVIKAVTSTMPDAESRAIVDAVYFDVGQKLIRGALESDEFVHDTSIFPQGSVGAVIRRLIAITFPGDTPEGLRSMMSERASIFDALLQDRLRLFRYR